MREVVMLSWCDGCQLEGALRTEATHTWTVGAVAGESKPALKVLELCDIHNKVIADLMVLLADVGQTPQLAPAPKPLGRPRIYEPVDLTPCPVCRTELNPGSLIGHVWTHHRKDKRPPAPKQCPDCGAGFNSAASCGTHRKSVHGFDPLDFALSGVKGFRALT